MKILLISRCPPYPIHLGDRLIIYHLARELSQQVNLIALLAFANSPDDWQIQWEQVAPYFRSIQLFHEPRRTTLDYLRRLILPARRFPSNAESSWSPELWRAIEAHIAKGDVDVVHLFGGVQVYEFHHAIGDLPAIIVPYESYSLYLRRALEKATSLTERLKTHLQHFMARRFESFMFAPYKRTVVVSERDREELLGINPKLSIEVIPNGIDLDYFQPPIVEREPATLLFTGNYEYAPNADAALRLATEILPQVRKSVPSARLWLVGNAPTPEMQAIANDTIIVTGRVPDIRPYLAQATIFVSPLRLGAGIKNKVLEALAMQLPIVATPLSVDGISVVHEHDALIVEDKHMVKSVIRLLHDTELRSKLATNGRARIEDGYSWKQAATLYENLYRKVLAP